MATIAYARHGQTELNRTARLQGRSSAHLTDLGRRQAQRLAESLVAESPVRVVSSPLVRAIETAEVIAARCDLVVEVDEDLIELDYGSWEGRPIADVSAEEWERWRSDPTMEPPGGESLGDVRARVARFASRVTLGDDTVVAVSHVSPIKAAVADALGAADAATWRMYLAVASISRVRIASRSGGPRGSGSTLVSFNETAHLATLE